MQLNSLTFMRISGTPWLFSNVGPSPVIVIVSDRLDEILSNAASRTGRTGSWRESSAGESMPFDLPGSIELGIQQFASSSPAR
ncbi:MAG: hypothetical protein OEU92_05220 [Alphaproteobacteria bacterium]|nr:hypothetical protein [Alphaproteobacteria bacterium]